MSIFLTYLWRDMACKVQKVEGGRLAGEARRAEEDGRGWTKGIGIGQASDLSQQFIYAV